MSWMDLVLANLGDDFKSEQIGFLELPWPVVKGTGRQAARQQEQKVFTQTDMKRKMNQASQLHLAYIERASKQAS